jgi:hypothetical protein
MRFENYLYIKTRCSCKINSRRIGANPTIMSYNASALKTYKAQSSLVRFENCFYIKTL